MKEEALQNCSFGLVLGPSFALQLSRKQVFLPPKLAAEYPNKFQTKRGTNNALEKHTQTYAHASGV